MERGVHFSRFEAYHISFLKSLQAKRLLRKHQMKGDTKINVRGKFQFTKTHLQFVAPFKGL